MNTGKALKRKIQRKQSFHKSWLLVCILKRSGSLGEQGSFQVDRKMVYVQRGKCNKRQKIFKNSNMFNKLKVEGTCMGVASNEWAGLKCWWLCMAYKEVQTLLGRECVASQVFLISRVMQSDLHFRKITLASWPQCLKWRAPRKASSELKATAEFSGEITKAGIKGNAVRTGRGH